MSEEPSNVSESLPQPAAAGRGKFKESVARTAAIAGFISLALSPASLVVGYWLNHLLAAPKLRPEYVTAVVVVKNAEPDWAGLDKLRKNQAASATVRDLLMRVALTKQRSSCTAWLDTNKWLDDCSGDVEDVLRWQSAALAAQLRDLDAGQRSLDGNNFVGVGSSELSAYISTLALKDKSSAKSVIAAKTAAVHADAILLDDVLNLVRKADEQPRPRTGDIVLRVGVVNTGDSDGVMTRQAVLKFGDSEVQMRNRKYVVIKAHSLEELEIEVDDRSTRSGDADRLHSLVRANVQDPFLLEMRPSDGPTIQVAGRFPE